MHREIKILIYASMVFNFGAGFFAPLYALYVRDIGGSILETGIAWAVYSIVFGLMIILIGKIEDGKINKGHMVTLGYLLIAFCALGYIFVQNPIQLFILQFFIGLGSAINTPAWDAIFSSSEDKGKEAFEWSIWKGGRSIIIGIASILGGLVVVLLGWAFLFVLMFIFEFAGAIVSFRLFRGKT